MATASSSLTEVLIPDLGDIVDVPVIEVLVTVGAEINVGQTLAVLETEKATMDVPSTAAGIVREVRIKVGDKISCGSVMVLLEPADAAVQPVPALSPVPPPSMPKTVPVPVATPESAVVTSAVPPHPSLSGAPAAPATDPDILPHASPSVRRFARELGVDLTLIRGTGPKDRIQHSDIQAYVKELAARPRASIASGTSLDLAPWPRIDFAQFGPIERTELSRIKKISAANLLRNSILIPHVTNFDEADITELEAFRVALNKEEAGKGSKLTMLAFLIKASVTALWLHPNFNASLEGDTLILKRYFHIGFAADTPNGLVVPVIRNVETKGLRAIAAEANSLAELARTGKLKPADTQGGCFTISSLGGIGGTGFTPIINAPEVAILGAARARMTPVWDGSEFKPRLILPLTLSWDHRAVDGAAAARFLVTLVQLLADFCRVNL